MNVFGRWCPTGMRHGSDTTRRLVSGTGVLGDPVHLTPDGLEELDGVVDWLSRDFLGVRTDDGIYRFMHISVFGGPTGVGHHIFADGLDQAETEGAWEDWLTKVFLVENRRSGWKLSPRRTARPRVRPARPGTTRGARVRGLGGRMADAAIAQELSSDFTVLNYDRRGRGDSGDTLPYAIEREVEDIEAVIDAAADRRTSGVPRPVRCSR